MTHSVFTIQCCEGDETLSVYPGLVDPHTRLVISVFNDDHVQEIVLTREQAADLATTIHEWLIHGEKNDVLP